MAGTRRSSLLSESPELAPDGTRGSESEDLPSFVLSTTSDLIKSSDSEAVAGMVSAFTFSFIQVSEASSSGPDADSADSAGSDGEPDAMPPIRESVEHEDRPSSSLAAADDDREYVVTARGSVETAPKSASIRSPTADEAEAEMTAIVVAAVVDEVVAAAIAGNEPEKVDGSSTAPLSSEPQWTYAVVGSADGGGVVRYLIQLTDGEQSKWPAPVARRFSEFRQLHIKLAADGAKLPPLPAAGLVQALRGRRSRHTIRQREKQLDGLLRFVTRHRELEQSAAFQSFVAH